MTALAIGAGAAVAGTLFQGYEALHQEHKANQLQKSLHDPVYAIPSEFYQNREIARQLAVQGLPQEVINQNRNQIAQSQAAGIQALSRSANPGAGVSGVVGQTNKANAQLEAEDAQARQNNQRYFMQENEKVADQELKKQQADVYDKYTRDFNTMQADRGAGLQNLNTAFQDLSGLGLTVGNYAMNQGAKPGTYKNINGQWHVADANGQFQPMVGNISAMNTNFTPPALTSTLPQ